MPLHIGTASCFAAFLLIALKGLNDRLCVQGPVLIDIFLCDGHFAADAEGTAGDF